MKVQNTIKTRPFAFSCILFLLFSFCFFNLNSAVKYIALAVSAFLLTVLILTKSKRKFIMIYVLPAIILSSASSVLFFKNYDNLATYDGKECSIDFVITDIHKSTDSFSSFTVNVNSVNGHKADFKSTLYVYDKFVGAPFSSHSARVDFKAYTESDPSYFSRLSQDVFLYATVKDNLESHDKTVKLFPEYYFKKINEFCSEKLNRYAGKIGGELSDAVILGNKSSLSPKSQYHFRLLGLSHMLAVSGLHLSVLIGTLSKLLQKIVRSNKKRSLFLIMTVIFYAGLTGFSSSVNRAALMFILLCFSGIFLRKNDSVTSLCASVGFICLVSPSALFDIGLWLSFLSTYGIVSVASPVCKRIDNYAQTITFLPAKWFIKLFSLLVFGTVPIIFSLPVIWITYGEISLVSPIANIAFTPFLLAILYIAPLVIVFSFIPPLAVLLGKLTALVSAGMLYLADSLSEYASILHIDYWFTDLLVPLLVLVLLSAALTGTKKYRHYFIPIIAFAAVFSLCFCFTVNNSTKRQSLIYQNSRYGDIILVVSNNQAMVCDLYGSASGNIGKIENALYEKHITELHSYLIVDLNARAYDMLDSLSAYTRLNTLYIPTGQTADEKFMEAQITEYAKANGYKTVSYTHKNDKQIEFFGITLDIKKNYTAPINSPSSYSITFSGNTKTLAYIGMGGFESLEGKMHLTELFQSKTPMIFGSYGKKTYLHTTALQNVSDTSLYFPSQEIFNYYKPTVHPDSSITFIKDTHEFLLNQ